MRSSEIPTLPVSHRQTGDVMLILKIIFLILIVICAIFYIMYIWNFSLILLIIMLAVPAVLFICTFITKKMLSVDFAVKYDTASKSQDFPVQIQLNNRSIFPVGKAEAHIEYYNLFNNQINTFELYMPIQARNTQSVTFQLKSKYCGIINVKCAYIYIFDPLRLFKFKVGKNISAEIPVMPDGHEISGTVSYSDRVNEESTRFSDTSPGDDPSEVFDLRDYIPGDKLNRIHWKLSSKMDDFIVKDYSLPVDIPTMIFLDMKCYEDSDYTLPVFDTLVESLISVSQFMLSCERMHTIVFFNGKQHRFVERIVDSQESLSALIQELITSITDNLYCESPDVYFLDNQNTTLSSFTFISSVTDTRILEYIEENIDSDLKNAIIVTKSPTETEKIRESCAGLEIIPVVIGKISASIKDIEL